MRRKDKNNSDYLIDNMISSFKIRETLGKKLAIRIRLMPEIKKNYDFVARDDTSIEANYFCDGFVEGAEWRINSVWNYDKSTPKPNNPILFIVHEGAVVLQISSEEDWKSLIKDRIFVKWAYIKDLIPNMEE